MSHSLQSSRFYISRLMNDRKVKQAKHNSKCEARCPKGLEQRSTCPLKMDYIHPSKHQDTMGTAYIHHAVRNPHQNDAANLQCKVLLIIDRT